MKQLTGLAGCAVLVVLSSSVPGLAWGELAHRRVNAAAIESLPNPLRSYFASRKAFLLEHAVDPDVLARKRPEEQRHHYTDVDAYRSGLWGTLKKLFLDERRGPTPFQLRQGDSVWQIERFTARLEQAMRHRRWGGLDDAAVFVAHYACDLTQPLHTTVNYDGQLTHQNGIHSRFETELVKTLSVQWVLGPQPLREEPDLRARIFRELVDSHSYLNPLLGADRIAVEGRSYQDPRYVEAFTQLAGPLARKRLEAAISFVASLWYTAWVRAGKPDLVATKFRAEKGRSCWIPPRQFSGVLVAEGDRCGPQAAHFDRRGADRCIERERHCGLSPGNAAGRLPTAVGQEWEGRLRGFY